jgi:hypothetical protein
MLRHLALAAILAAGMLSATVLAVCDGLLELIDTEGE